MDKTTNEKPKQTRKKRVGEGTGVEASIGFYIRIKPSLIAKLDMACPKEISRNQFIVKMMEAEMAHYERFFLLNKDPMLKLFLEGPGKAHLDAFELVNRVAGEKKNLSLINA